MGEAGGREPSTYHHLNHGPPTHSAPQCLGWEASCLPISSRFFSPFHGHRLAALGPAVVLRTTDFPPCVCRCLPEPLPHSSCITSASPTGTISSEEWALLEGTTLASVRRPPGGGCQTSLHVRAGVEPTPGNNSSELRVKAHEPTPVVWRLVGGYSGPILLRGRQLDGNVPVYFAPSESRQTGTAGAGTEGPPIKTLQTDHGPLPLYAGLELTAAGSAASWSTYAYVESPGCFFWQQNGIDFQGILIFQATA